MSPGQELVQLDSVPRPGGDHELSGDVEGDLVLRAVGQQVTCTLQDQACLERTRRVVEPRVDHAGVVAALVQGHPPLLLHEDSAAAGVELLQRLGNGQAHDATSDDDVGKHQRRSHPQRAYSIRDLGTR